MAKQSAGILLYQFNDQQLQVFLVHPGGPFFKKKDDGVWSIPKGEFGDNEDALAAARREFKEETGHVIEGSFLPLEPVQQKNGKTVYAWAVAGSIDQASILSNNFEMEWPPKSGKKQNFPEIDRADWFTVDQALIKINGAQTGFIQQLLALLAGK